MKLVVAIIRPEKYDAVQAALDELQISQMTFSEVWGRGHERGPTLIYRATTFQDTRIRRLKLEVAVNDEDVDATVEAVQRYAKTGRVGDGVILVAPLERFIHIPSDQCSNRLDCRKALAEPVHLTPHRVNQTIAAASFQ